MKTDELIGLLGNSFEREPAGTPWMTRQLALAVAVGATVALCLALAFLGLRPGLTQARPLLFLALKVAFAVAVGGSRCDTSPGPPGQAARAACISGSWPCLSSRSRRSRA